MLHKIFFTGGLDSAYRICQLAQDENAIIQPIYILFPKEGNSNHVRPELEREIQAQDKILQCIKENPNTKAKFLPMQRVHRDAIQKENWVMELEDALGEVGLGWQFMYMYLYTKWNPGIEFCQEVLWDFLEERNVKFKTENGNKYIDMDGVSDKLVLIFKDLYWPILGITRKEMTERIKEWGYAEVLKHLWFCYSSINGKPCGICDSCQKKLAEGLRFLFPKEAVHRFLVYRFCWTFHPKGSPILYSNYVHGNTFYLLNVNANKSDVWMNAFLKHYRYLEKLSIKQLKYILINGSFDYGYREALRNMIKNASKDKERREYYKNLFQALGI